jgi:hypothetical protein
MLKKSLVFRECRVFPGFFFAGKLSRQLVAGLFGKSNASTKARVLARSSEGPPGAGTCHVYAKLCPTEWRLEKDDACSQQPTLTCFPVYVTSTTRFTATMCEA